MHSLRYLFFLVGFSVPLKGAYEPSRYTQFIKDSIGRLNSLQESNERKINLLEAHQEHATRRKKEGKSIALENALVPILSSNRLTLEGLRAENNLLKAERTRLTQELSPARLETLSNADLENSALQKATIEASLEELKKNKARAEFARQFFQQEKNIFGRDLSSNYSSFEQQWAQKATDLNRQISQKVGQLRAGR